MLFSSERLHIKPWEENDLDDLYCIFSNTALKESIAPKLTIEETVQIFEQQLNEYEDQGPFGRYFIVEKESQHFIGLFLLKKLENAGEVEIGYSLKKEFWKKGYATETVQGCSQWLFQQPEVLKIFAVTEPENIDSQKVLLRSGFSREKNIMEDGMEMAVFCLER